MKFLNKVVLAASVAGGLSMVAAAPASAYLACNHEGDCWHTDKRVKVPGITFAYHPDDWYFHQKWDNDRHYRDYHEGRGYYKNGVWITL